MTAAEQKPAYVRSDCPAIPGMRRFAHEAMATTFELIVVHDDERYARQAAAAAFEEVDRLEAELSRFIENSDIARINSLSPGRPLVLGLPAFECMAISRRIYDQTGGAFDITIGSLLSCWRENRGALRTPSQGELAEARRRTGAHLLRLNEDEHTVVVLAEGVQVDLGGVGKGYAVGQVAKLLREWDIDTALLSGGYSSVLALDPPPGMKGWPVSLSHPRRQKETLAKLSLANRALGSSGLQKGSHIIDPRTGTPAEAKIAVWSSAPDAATADALSTAFMVMSADEISQYCRRYPEVMAMVIGRRPGEGESAEEILRFGCWDQLYVRV